MDVVVVMETVVVGALVVLQVLRSRCWCHHLIGM
jgi:hypothetical protein